MKTLSVLMLAAGAALIPGVAAAQPAPRQGPPPGVTWQERSVAAHPGGFRPGPDFPHRLRRGHVIHPFWFGPRFHINNWQLYGFADPGADGRWIRYYDDAYLIDRGGRVRDAREGLDWDQYGERWDEEDGIPAYHGRGDYRPGDEDYAWVREYQGEFGPGYAEQGGYGPYPGGGYYTQPMIIDTIVTGTSVRTVINGEVVDEIPLAAATVAPRAAVRRPPRSVAAPRPAPRRMTPAPVARIPAPPPAVPPPAAPPPRPEDAQTPGL